MLIIQRTERHGGVWVPPGVMEPFPHQYEAAAVAEAAGDVTVHSGDLQALRSAAPRQFGGPGDRWSPETLLMGAVADCFILTFRAVAGASRLSWCSITCVVEGTLERENRVTRFTHLLIRPRLRVPEGTDEASVLRLLARTEENCLVTRSLNAEVRFEAEIEQVPAIDTCGLQPVA
jgi:organic hydroperoxide reductase OsmC/OhrA